MNNDNKQAVRAQIETRIQAIFTQLFELDKAKLKPGANLYLDLGLDSIDAIDLVVSFETEFKMRPSDEEMRAIRTLEDVYALAEKYYERGPQAK